MYHFCTQQEYRIDTGLTQDEYREREREVCERHQSPRARQQTLVPEVLAAVLYQLPSCKRGQQGDSVKLVWDATEHLWLPYVLAA